MASWTIQAPLLRDKAPKCLTLVRGMRYESTQSPIIAELNIGELCPEALSSASWYLELPGYQFSIMLPMPSFSGTSVTWRFGLDAAVTQTLQSGYYTLYWDCHGMAQVALAHQPLIMLPAGTPRT